ncbi:MAG: multicopper oxidase domain-containing protein [Phycisphaerales bacterium]|nr:multicopper oxidase domain-containing protein [Phycisphaerales bacterium]
MTSVRGTWLVGLVCGAAMLVASVAQGVVVDIVASKDASIYEEVSDVANGAGVYIHCGNNSNGFARRALVQFDLSVIPSGSTITAATLTIRVDDGGNSGPTETVELRRVTQEWSEGPSDPGGPGGGGVGALPGDVTWSHRNWSTLAWTNPGGTFAGTASASASVSSVAGPKTFTSAGMVSDLQNWLDAPSTNFGWLLLGNETGSRTARRISSRQNPTPSEAPTLTVTYTAPASTGACCAAGGGCSIGTGASCSGGGGTFQGIGTSCAPNPCPQPTGACCGAGGACSVLTATECGTAAGTYVSNGSVCSPNPCPLIPGGCCAANATCSVVSLTVCSGSGGAYRGYNTSCSGVECPWVLTPFIDPLPLPAVAVPDSGSPGDAAAYTIDIAEFTHRFHSELPLSTVWGYDGLYPGPTIEARRDRPVSVRWTNNLRDHDSAGQPLKTQHVLPVDTCLHGPDVWGSVPRTVVHLHGGHVAPESDGLPDLAFPPGQSSPLYTYPNNQQAGTLWYHDHALGLTRLNVYMGLAGFYLLRDDAEAGLNLPQGPNEIPLAIQDRSFTPAGQLRYNTTFMDHFFGDFITVNGKVWPYLDVRRGKYRFRVLNGCNSRTFTLRLVEGAAVRPMVQIGTDVGLLPAPITINSLTLMPGERADVVIDFESIEATNWRLENSALSPFPAGGIGPDITTVMEFRNTGVPGDTDPLPATLVPVPPIPVAEAVQTRDLHLQKVFDTVCNHDMWLINSLMWDDITEFPVLGTAEIWRWINRSGVSHPMHMHLVQFQVLDRQGFTIGPGDTVVPSGPVIPPAPNELGWKDTVQATPNQITRVITRFLDYPGTFPYHCHILDHEDHEMMRQFSVVCPPVTFATQPTNINVRRGQTATLTAVAGGQPPTQYQWRRTSPDVTYADGPTGNGSIVSGAQAPIFGIANVQFADAGHHTCTATGACGGMAVSQTANITVFCSADFNFSGFVTVQDLFDFLTAYFAGLPSADINENDLVSVQDIFDFLTLYFGPC